MEAPAMNGFFAFLAAPTLLIGIQVPALAQAAPDPHQHGQPPVAQPAPPAHKGDCDCCQMMKEMMQMMHSMHGQGMQKPGGMMQGPDKKQPAPPQHERGSN